jgi:hypothetical protein
MLPLIPLAISLAPEIARWLFGTEGEKTATAVVAAVQSATGTADENVASQMLATNPQAAVDLRVKLAQIAAERERTASDAQLTLLKSQLADIADARALTVSLAQSKSAVQWAAPVVSAIVLTTFGAVMFLALTRALPAGSETLLNMLLGSLAAMSTSVVSYWVGSSAGSAQKTDLLYRSTPLTSSDR